MPNHYIIIDMILKDILLFLTWVYCCPRIPKKSLNCKESMIDDVITIYLQTWDACVDKLVLCLTEDLLSWRESQAQYLNSWMLIPVQHKLLWLFHCLCEHTTKQIEHVSLISEFHHKICCWLQYQLTILQPKDKYYHLFHLQIFCFAFCV